MDQFKDEAVQPSSIPIEVEPGWDHGRRVWAVTGPIPAGISPNTVIRDCEITTEHFYAVWAERAPHGVILPRDRRGPRRPSARVQSIAPTATVAGVPPARTIRSHRRAHQGLALAGRALGSVAVAGVLAAGVGVLMGGPGNPKTAEAASPFADPVWQAVAAEDGWQCDTDAGRRVASCTNAGVTARAEEYDGPEDSKIFILAYDVDGEAHRDILRVYTDPEAVARIVAVAQDDPAQYPNLRKGKGWVMTSTRDWTRKGADATTAPAPTPTATTRPVTSATGGVGRR